MFFFVFFLLDIFFVDLLHLEQFKHFSHITDPRVCIARPGRARLDQFTLYLKIKGSIIGDHLILLGNQSDVVFDICCWGSSWKLAILNQ